MKNFIYKKIKFNINKTAIIESIITNGIIVYFS